VISGEESAASALEILRGWQWGYFDPDHCWHGRSIELAEVVNRLAFQGHNSPISAVLRLLCEGKITAICSYRWLKYQHSVRYEISEHMEYLDKSKWQTLARMLEYEQQMLDDCEWGSPTTNLPKLELKDCEPVEWEPSLNRCAYAACPPDTSTFDPTYYEEFFSADEIEIKHVFEEPAEENFDTEYSEEQRPLNHNPHLSQAELTKWWDSKAEVRDLLSKDELLVLVRAKYPDKVISRDRVRDLIGTRKRGPKPFRGDLSAK
jgi:hypothetical protein